MMCLCAFVKRVNRGYTHTQYTSTGDVPAIIEDIPSSNKALKQKTIITKGCTGPLECPRIHY